MPQSACDISEWVSEWLGEWLGGWVSKLGHAPYDHIWAPVSHVIRSRALSDARATARVVTPAPRRTSIAANTDHVIAWSLMTRLWAKHFFIPIAKCLCIKVPRAHHCNTFTTVCFISYLQWSERYRRRSPIGSLITLQNCNPSRSTILKTSCHVESISFALHLKLPLSQDWLFETNASPFRTYALQLRKALLCLGAHVKPSRSAPFTALHRACKKSIRIIIRLVHNSSKYGDFSFLDST